MGTDVGDGAFSGKWMDEDGALIIIKATQLTWPDGTTSNIAIKDRETLEMTVGGEVLAGQASDDGTWLIWNDGDTWFRLLGDMEACTQQGPLKAIGLEDDDDDEDDDNSDGDGDFQEESNMHESLLQMLKPPVREAAEDKEALAAARSLEPVELQQAHKEDLSIENPEEAVAKAPEAQAPLPGEPKELRVGAPTEPEPVADREVRAEDEDPRLAKQLPRQREEKGEEQRCWEEWKLMRRSDEQELAEKLDELSHPGATNAVQDPWPAPEAPQPAQPTAAETPAAAVEVPLAAAAETPAAVAVEVRQPAAGAHRGWGEAEAASCHPGASGPVECDLPDTAEAADAAVSKEAPEQGELAAEVGAEDVGGGVEEASQGEQQRPPEPSQPRKPVRRIEEPLTMQHRLEQVASVPAQLASPMPLAFPKVYIQPLEYKVVAPHTFIRKIASLEGPRVTLLNLDDVIHGYQQGQWLHVQKAFNSGWVFVDGSSEGPARCFEHKYLKLRVQRTFAEGVLLEWDKLHNARFVDYAVQWSLVSDPMTITTAASHIPRASAKIEGLPSQVELKLRVVACIYTDTKSSGGERFAAVVGPWVEAKTLDDPAVEALERPMPEKMTDVYSRPLEYTVIWRQVVIRAWPSTKAKALGTLPRGEEVAGYQQGDWISLTKPCPGWLLIDGERLGFGRLLGHDYLKCRVLRSFSEAILVEWGALECAKVVDYALEWAHSESGPVSLGNDDLPRTVGFLRGLPPDEKLLVRVCAKVHTQTKGNAGFQFTTVVGPWRNTETEAAVTELEEESLCMDPMANLRGRCMDCACRGLVGMQLEPDLQRRTGLLDHAVLCRRCGCGCRRHVIVGEYHHVKTAGSSLASAFKLPACIVKEAEREARQAQQAQKALSNDAPSGPRPLQQGKPEVKVWCPEDSGLDGDRVSFVLDKIAQARTLYETLGVAPDCENREIRHAHRRISLYIHPDKVLNRNDQDLVKQAEAAFKIVSAAYEVLGDSLKRSSYDQSIRNSGYVIYTSSTCPTRKDLSVASLLRRFLSKATWGWDLHAKPPGDWEEFGKGVYGLARNANLTVVHAITNEELVIPMDRGTSLNRIKHCIVSHVKRGPPTAIELATVDGEVLQDDFRIPHSMTLVLAGISSLGPAKPVRLCLSHAHTGARHHVEVWDTATMEEVRDVAARSLQVLPNNLRLGYRYNNKEKLKDFEEEDFLNGRTHILVLGVEIPINLSAEEATELQSELIQAYKDESFQRELDELLAHHPPPDGLVNPDFKERWSCLLRLAQKNILLKHGFDGPHGAATMLAAFSDVDYHPEVQRLGAEIDALLRVTVGTALPPVTAVQVQPADEDLSGDAAALRGIKVVLPVDSSIGDLKEGIARKLNEDIHKIEVVTLEKHSPGRQGDITIHEDSELVGRHRLFQVQGIRMPSQEVLDQALLDQRRHTKRLAAERLRARVAQDEIDAWEAARDCTGCSTRLATARGHVSADDQQWYCNRCWANHHRGDGRQAAALAILAVDSIIAAENGIDRETRKCTTPDCQFRMHRNACLGASVFCCVRCKEGLGHDSTCERRRVGRDDSPEPLPDGAAPKLARKLAKPAELRTPPRLEVPACQAQLALAPASEQPLEVTVEVRSYNHSNAICLNVHATWRWIDAKRALARKVGRPDILRAGKLAYRDDDGGYSSVVDMKLIEESQEVFLFNSDMSYNPRVRDLDDKEYWKAEKEREQAGILTEKKAPQQQSRESLLTVTDLRTSESLDLKILKNMTAIEVKHVVAWATKRPQQEFQSCKLLKKCAEGYLSIQDAENAGQHRKLWMMDATLTPMDGSPAKQYLKRDQPVVCRAIEEERAAARKMQEASLLKLQTADPEWVLVGIAHAVKKDESSVEVLVMDDCLLGTVLEVLSQRLNSRQVQIHGKFVERKGASYRSLKLDEPLKQRRELLFIGTDLKQLRAG